MALAAQARTPSASAGAASTTRFVSKKYGYTVELDGTSWYPTYAVTRWLGGFPFGHSPDVDLIGDMRDRKFIVAAKPVSAGLTLEDWTSQHVATLQSMQIAGKPLCHKSRAFRNTTLGGEPAREFQNGCGPGDNSSDPGYDVIVLTAVHHGRGYIFQFVSPAANTAASDRRIYEVGRRSFRFAAK